MVVPRVPPPPPRAIDEEVTRDGPLVAPPPRVVIAPGAQPSPEELSATAPSNLFEAILPSLARRVHPKLPLWLVVLAVLAPFLVVALAVSTRQETGKLRIAASSSQGGVDKVEVFVDGQKRCEVIPCLIEELTPGQKFVRVIAAGFAPAQPITVSVEPGVEQFAVVSLGEPRPPK